MTTSVTVSENQQHDRPEPAANAEAATAAEAAKVVSYAGEWIYLRPSELEDEPLLRRWINDPRNWRGLMCLRLD